MDNSKIILAADGLSLPDVVSVSKQLKDRLYAVKIHDLFDIYGGYAVKAIRNVGIPKVWVDVKLHDTPDTMRKRKEVIAKSGADIITVHAAGGVEMMKAAVEGTYAEIYAVTMLTSLTEAEAYQVYGRSLNMVAIQYATWAKEAGVSGLVCSAYEVKMLSSFPYLQDLKFIVPGVRSDGVSHDDQKRVATPKKALLDGATHLVIGRQVTRAVDRVAALSKIEKEIESVL